jgi:5'(3')-deoxyribonucleotidase
MIQKIALVDVCDVAVDLRQSTIKAAKLNIDTSIINDWDIFSILNAEECARVIKLFNDPEFWRNLPPVPGVHEGIEGLKRQGYTIHWLTSPWFTCENWESIRRIWLHEQFGTHPLEITFTAEKFRVTGDMFIDDRPKHISLWHAAHPDKDAWLFDSTFNRFFEWSPRGIWTDAGISLCNR